MNSQFQKQDLSLYLKIFTWGYFRNFHDNAFIGKIPLHENKACMNLYHSIVKISPS